MLRYLTSWIRNFAASLEMTCQDAEHVHSRCCDGVADPGQRSGLWIHHLYCKGCRVYAKQVNLLRAAAARLRGNERSAPPADGLSMPADVTDRLKSKLRPYE